MWNKRLVAFARVYPSGIVTLVEDSGYPLSVRCAVEFDDARELIVLLAPPPDVAGRQGPTCLLFHRHDADLSGQRELLIKGELREEAGVLILRPDAFLTGSGRQDTDRMPYAGSALDIMRYMLLGRRKARAYLAKRGEPWTPRPWAKMLRYLDES
jgi:hypothetical protein